MAFSGDGAVSSNQRTFLTEALATGLRLDGRDLLDMRRLKFSFTRSANRATAEVQLGRTRCEANHLAGCAQRVDGSCLSRNCTECSQ